MGNVALKASTETHEATSTEAPEATSTEAPATTSTKASCRNSDYGGDRQGHGCESYDEDPSRCGKFDGPQFHSKSVCCACGKGQGQVTNFHGKGTVKSHAQEMTFAPW